MNPISFTEHKSDWGSWIQSIGTFPILFSAPHEHNHFREGRIKEAEHGTSKLAFSLASSIGGSAISPNAALDSDPNWDADHPYINQITQIFESGLILDIHMMKDRGFPACLGLGKKPERVDGIWQKLITELVNQKVDTCVGWPFGAGSQTITSQLQQRGYQAIQIELTPICYKEGSDENIRVKNSLLNFCKSII